jgi:hypothetical protein
MQAASYCTRSFSLPCSHRSNSASLSLICIVEHIATFTVFAAVYFTLFALISGMVL